MEKDYGDKYVSEGITAKFFLNFVKRHINNFTD